MATLFNDGRFMVQWVGFFRSARRGRKPAMRWFLHSRSADYRVIYIGLFKINLPARRRTADECTNAYYSRIASATKAQA